MVGINKYDPKDRRRARRRNHIAKDLRSPKYREQVVPDRKRKSYFDDESEVYYDYED